MPGRGKLSAKFRLARGQIEAQSDQQAHSGCDFWNTYSSHISRFGDRPNGSSIHALLELGRKLDSGWCAACALFLNAVLRRWLLKLNHFVVLSVIDDRP